MFYITFSLICVLLLAPTSFSAPNSAPPLKELKEKVTNEEVNEERADHLATWHRIIQLLRTKPQLMNEWNQRLEADLHSDDIYVPWECPALEPSPTTPTSVHQLRPSDIKVVAALGDSITAGNGVRATTPWMVLVPNRGESWSIGGEKSLAEGVLTLPNILRNFNANLTGASTCRRMRATQPESEFNVAVPGDTNLGLADQATTLMQKMLQMADVDYYNDWKLVTIFIGGNDLCRSCQLVNANKYSANAYYEGVKAAIDLLWNHLPRVLINLQPMFDVSIVKDLIHPDTVALCESLHSISCPCFNRTTELKELQQEYYVKMTQLADGRYDSRPDLTVVLQPHFKDFVPPTYPNGSFDMSYVAPDCFHPSAKAHQGFAYMLWNVMLTPVGQKPLNYDLNESPMAFKCPTESNPYIYTNCNSGLDDSNEYCKYYGFP